eukprot:c28943_g1_i1 orf=138-344(+)
MIYQDYNGFLLNRNCVTKYSMCLNKWESIIRKREEAQMRLGCPQLGVWQAPHLERKLGHPLSQKKGAR